MLWKLGMQIVVDYLLKIFLKCFKKSHGKEKKEEEEVKSSHPTLLSGNLKSFDNIV